MINFNEPIYEERAFAYMKEAIAYGKLSGDGIFTAKCSEWIEQLGGIAKALLTTSCTHATEMAAMLSKIGLGDEVIAPSYTFVSTVNAFVLRGAKIRFVDICPETMNMDEKLIESAITQRTKAIVPVHYAGVACEMDTIMDIANNHHLVVIEDAAQGVWSTYKDKALGTIGDYGCYSFHETKNYSMGEGGAILIKQSEKVKEAEIIREKGTNRKAFFRGEIDKYSWVSEGSSYLPSELGAAYLWAQLEHADEIYENRMNTWKQYQEGLQVLEEKEKVRLPYIPEGCRHNAHMFYIKTKNLRERTDLLRYLKEREINAVFHYVPLHSSLAGQKYGEFVGKDRYTTQESEKIIRLPLYYGIKNSEIDRVIEAIHEFYKGYLR